MNSISLKEKPTGATASRITTLQADASGLVSTLKTARFPELGATTEWISPPELKDTQTKDRHDSDIFDASLRAVAYHKRVDNTMPQLKLVEFSLELPEATTVQLVADFTDWEQYPLDMVRFGDDIWSTTVPLPAGIYAYRFLVDGEWYDDPRAIRRDEDSCGAARAFVHVK